MIATSSTAFAIAIAAVAYASGTYGPRLLNNFMNDRGNQLSLGIFIASERLRGSAGRRCWRKLACLESKAALGLEGPAREELRVRLAEVERQLAD